MIGPTAAIALPPQIAVPVEIKKRRNSPYAEQRAQAHPRQQREADAHHGVEKPAAPGPNHLVQVHAEAQPHDRGLQQTFGELPGLAAIGMRKQQTEDKSHRQSHGRGDVAACANQQTEKENNFREHLQEKSPPPPAASWPGPPSLRLPERRVQRGDFQLRRFAERFDGLAFRAAHVKHRQQLGHLQKIADTFRQVRQLDGSAGIERSRV